MVHFMHPTQVDFMDVGCMKCTIFAPFPLPSFPPAWREKKRRGKQEEMVHFMRPT